MDKRNCLWKKWKQKSGRCGRIYYESMCFFLHESTMQNNLRSAYLTALIKCDKIIVEFLRVNWFIKQWFKIDYSDYTLKEWGYNHLPLEKKIQLISKIKKPQISVCEDVEEHYQYRKQHFNYNPEDCCNLNLNIT